jgi:hypothetical protein
MKGMRGAGPFLLLVIGLARARVRTMRASRVAVRYFVKVKTAVLRDAGAAAAPHRRRPNGALDFGAALRIVGLHRVGQ